MTLTLTLTLKYYPNPNPNPNPNPTQERNQMTVAYYLILDHKRRKMLGSSPIMHATQQQVLSNPSPGPSPSPNPNHHARHAAAG